MNFVGSISKNTSWDDLLTLEEFNFRVFRVPEGVKEGEILYIAHDGYIKGYSQVIKLEINHENDTRVLWGGSYVFVSKITEIKPIIFKYFKGIIKTDIKIK